MRMPGQRGIVDVFAHRISSMYLFSALKLIAIVILQVQSKSQRTKQVHARNPVRKDIHNTPLPGIRIRRSLWVYWINAGLR